MITTEEALRQLDAVAKGLVSLHLASTIAKDRADVTQTFQETISRIKRKCEAQRLPERYLLTIRGERGALQYGLLIAPERITWNHHTVSPGSP